MTIEMSEIDLTRHNSLSPPDLTEPVPMDELVDINDNHYDKESDDTFRTASSGDASDFSEDLNTIQKDTEYEQIKFQYEASIDSLHSMQSIDNESSMNNPDEFPMLTDIDVENSSDNLQNTVVSSSPLQVESVPPDQVVPNLQNQVVFEQHDQVLFEQHDNVGSDTQHQVVSYQEDKLASNEQAQKIEDSVTAETVLQINNTLVQHELPKPKSEYSAATRQFLDLLDLATGRKPLSGYSFLKDRIGSLMKNATRKKWAVSQGPRWTGLGVNNIVHRVENRNKKAADPELIKRGRFVARKGSAPPADALKHAGKWQNEVSRDKFANIPHPTLADDLKSHISSMTKKVLKFGSNFKKSETNKKGIITMHDGKVKTGNVEPTNEDNSYPKQGKHSEERYSLTSLCDNVNDRGFNFENMTDLEKTEHSRTMEECRAEFFSNKVPRINIREDRNEERIIDRNETTYNEEEIETDISVQSINEILAARFDSSQLANNSGDQYFIEEECIMLSPYSNEAKLYRLLFPGNRIPVKMGKVGEPVECVPQETAEVLVECQEQSMEICVTTTNDVEEIMECATVDESMPLLTSPYTDDMWVTESEVEAEPKVEVPEPTQEPKEKRKWLEKKKKVYDRSFVKAIQTNHVDLVQELLNEGANPNTGCSIGTVLHQSSQLGFSYVVQALLWGGAETERRNELGDTALHIASIAGHNEIVLMLTTHGCDIDAGNNYGITPLQMALSYGRLSVIQTLVRMNADILSKDRIGDSPEVLVQQLGYPISALDASAAEIAAVKEIPAPLNLVHAVENASLDQLREALSQEASADTIVPLTLHWPGHSTVLHRASHLGLLNIVIELLSAGANVNARDLVGNTPLHTAVLDAHNEVVKILIDGGANLNARTQSDVTPLHRAAGRGHQSTMMMLLKYGADATAIDHQNRTPLEWAKKKGFMMLARSLVQHMS